MENDNMFYHGTDEMSAKSICNKILLSKSKENLDFGPGFYITKSYETAKKWAQRKSETQKKRPAIVIIEFDYLQAEPYIKKFENDIRWGQFIVNNRNGKDYIDKMENCEHNLDKRYDITYGRIADYNIHKVIKILKDKNTPLEDIKDILNPYYTYQYAFHTEKALKFLKCIDYKII